MPATAVKGDMAGTMEQVETTKIIKTGDRAPAPAPNKEEAPTSTKDEAMTAPGGPKHLPKEAKCRISLARKGANVKYDRIRYQKNSTMAQMKRLGVLD